jgi:hypothetical protein
LACRATGYQLAISEGPQMSDVNKPARDYLKASGATSISVVAIDGVCTFQAGHKIDTNAVSVFWLTETVAAAVVKTARQLAGKAPDAATADAALHRAAAVNRTILTPHASEMARASRAVKGIDAYMETMRKNGQLSVFNGRYKRERAAATASGTGFMTYPQALARLRRVLIPIMATGVQQGVGTLFAQIFPAK